MNLSRGKFLLLAAVVVFSTTLYIRERAIRKDSESQCRRELQDLRERVDGMARALAEMQSSYDVSTPGIPATGSSRPSLGATGASAEVTLLAHLIGELAVQQSNTVALLVRREGATTESPEQTAQRKDATRTILLEKKAELDREFETATQRTEELRVSLNVPDNLAAKDAYQAIDDPILYQYRSFWEAKRDLEDKRRIRSIMQLKIANDLLDLDLPKAK